MHGQMHFPGILPNIKFYFPPVYAINERHGSNTIQQLFQPGYPAEVTVASYSSNGTKGKILRSLQNEDDQTLVIEAGVPPDEFTRVIRLNSKRAGLTEDSFSEATGIWIRHPDLSQLPSPTIDFQKIKQEVLESWKKCFAFLEEDTAEHLEGLRPPQTGAIHAIHAHWAASDQIATVVMPTGTGKTETMLATLVSRRCERLLVVVPTDALRTQIADKFLTLGILKRIRVISESAQYPIVGVLHQIPKSIDEIDSFFSKCQVIVTTMQIAGRCPEEFQERIASFCPYLFIDEAHHIAAQTWRNFKEKFSNSRIIQFTATPFRNDGQHVGGKFIFNFPLSLAQKQGYYRTIRFQPVNVFDPKKSDAAIAEKAVAQLREDCQKYKHILMARVGSIERAEQIFTLYQKYSEFHPVMIHSGIKSVKQRNEIRKQLLNGEAKIVVCVDMLGEGFDLPELKIAAFHDIRKSLAITLQLAGRFTRSRSDLGDPTFIANTEDVVVQDELQKLYSRDPDWNILLPQSSEKVIQDQVELWEFIEGFSDFPQDIPMQNIHPATSTVIYKTKCETWNPENYLEGIEGSGSYERITHGINHQENTLIIITAKKVPIDWAKTKDIYNWDWELFVVFWDQAQNLLFINSSSNNGMYKKLAEAVAGKDAELIEGGPLFRCFYNIKRLKLQNVGLIQQIGRLIRYTMRAGSDVEAGLSEAQKKLASKANMFGAGFEGGTRTSVGCSYKGRVWSHKATHIHHLTKWCSAIGKKVLDETIDPDEVLKGTLLPVVLSQRPSKMPFCIEWPEKIYLEPENAFEIIVDGCTHLPIYKSDIELINPAEAGDIQFLIKSDENNVQMKLSLFETEGHPDCKFSVIGNHTAVIARGERQSNLTDFFQAFPPTIWFIDGSSLAGNIFYELKHMVAPYPREKIEDRDWSGVNIRKESQGVEKANDSIQYHVIQALKQKNTYDIIYDDDSSGEIADIVCIKDGEKDISMELYHCKFSGDDKPGGRVDDLYAVCGQAQKCTDWMEKVEDLFRHLRRREPKREKGLEASRFEVGNQDVLSILASKSRLLKVNISVFIVQPGLSKAKASKDQLELISVTEDYLNLYLLPFKVIASP